MALAEQQIKTAFEQSEKEVLDLHTRILEGIREVKKNGVKVGIAKGVDLHIPKILTEHQLTLMLLNFVVVQDRVIINIKVKFKNDK
ncbi:MAG: hypothetical protein IJ039_09335 [Clostridia bacterium]|nr:hypothetical protein [Clostridia bacterium]